MSTGDWAAAGITAVVLAAGRSSRFAAESKLLLPHPTDGAPLLRHATLAVLALAPAGVVVVVRPDLPALAAALAGLPVRVIANPDYEAGMATSLSAGIRALPPEAGGALIVLGDTPAVAPAIFEGLWEGFQAAQRPITLPDYGGTPGPPTLFTRAAFSELLALEGDQGGRILARRHPQWVTTVPFPAALLPPDIDTAEDYARFCAAVSAEPAPGESTG